MVVVVAEFVVVVVVVAVVGPVYSRTCCLQDVPSQAARLRLSSWGAHWTQGCLEGFRSMQSRRGDRRAGERDVRCAVQRGVCTASTKIGLASGKTKYTSGRGVQMSLEFRGWVRSHALPLGRFGPVRTTTETLLHIIRGTC